MASIFRLLNNRVAVWIAFLLALFSRYLLFFNCGYDVVVGDKRLQVAAAVSILKGNGYTIPVINANDFASIQHISITIFPPLYTYFLIPLLKITGMDINLSCYIITIFSITIFLGFIWRVLIQIGFSHILQFFLIIWMGFFLRQFMIDSPPTDFLAAGFFVGALSFFLSFLNNNKKSEFIITVVFLMATAYTRYMYLPIVFIFPLLLVWAGYRQKNKNHVLTGYLAALICFITLSPLLLQNYILSGNLNNYWTKGLFFKNLLTFSQVFWDAFFDKDFIIYQIHDKTQIDYQAILKFFLISNYIVIFALTVYLLRTLFFRKEILISGHPYNNFFVVGGMICLSIIFFLAYLSLTNDLDWKRLGIGFPWTYFTDNRYYIFVHFYLLVIVVYNCFNTEKANVLASVAQKILLLLFLVDVSHGLWLLNKSYTQTRDMVPNYAYDSERKVDKLINQSRNENFEPLFFLSYDYTLSGYASLNNVKQCIDFENFDEKNLLINRPTQLFLVVYKGAAKNYYNSFIKKQGFELIENLKDSTQVFSKRILLNEK